MNIAIIPARGGSKRISGKNIKLFCDKPIIAYSIEAANESGIFDRIIVSTDSVEIAAVANKYGAETPFVRPEKISDDFATTASVVEHALSWFAEKGESVDFACCIYATAPFVQSKYLQQGYEKLIQQNNSVVFSVTSFPSSIYRALEINKKGYLSMIYPEHELSRSNDLPEAYSDAGQFYWLKVEKFMENHRLYSKDALPIILPRYLAQDIDTPEDWQKAELMYGVIQKRLLREP